MARDTTQTTNRSYDRPELGADWAASWDELVEDLDVAVHLEGTYTNRPADPPTDTKYYATDYKILYQYNGTSWDFIWGAGTASNPLPEQYTESLTTDGLNVTSWEWMDVVDNGLANDGSEDTGAFIDSNQADNRVLVFPPGTYSFDTGVTIELVENFGLLAPTGGVTFTEGTIGTSSNMIQFGTSTNPAKNMLLKGIDTDTTAASFLELKTEGRTLIENVEFTAEKTASDAIFHVDIRVLNENGYAVFRNVRMPEGGTVQGDVTDEAGGFYVFSDHAGDVFFENCMVGGFPNNGIYASAPSGSSNGRTHVRGGTFKNSNVANIRIGGDGSSIRDTTIIFDTLKTDFTNLRGIYTREGTGHQIDNVKIRIDSGLDGAHMGISHLGGAGTATYRDVLIEDNGGARAVRVYAEDSGTYPVTFENFELRGDAPSSGEAWPVYIVRGETVLREAKIDQPNRDGIWVNANGVYLENSNISTGGDPLLIQGDDFRERNVTKGAGASYDGARDVINGWGENAGDPNTTGEWNGNGYEGAAVVDTTNNNKYVYRGGAWV